MTDDPSRRAFVRSLALGTSAGLLSPSSRAATAPQDEPQEAEAPDPIEREIEARMAILLARHGDSLDEEARGQVRRQVAGVVRRGRSLKEYPVDNGVGPFPVFRPYRAPIA